VRRATVVEGCGGQEAARTTERTRARLPIGEPGPRSFQPICDYFWKIAKPQKQGFVLHAAIVTFTL